MKIFSKLAYVMLILVATLSCEDKVENVTPAPYTVLAIATGGAKDALNKYSESHTCALLSSGSVKCWGANSYGQLGQGDRDGRGDDVGDMGNNLGIVNLGSGRTATAIATGGLHSCAILDDSSLKCWGYNFYGQLGIESTNDMGDDPDEMGDSLTTVNLGTGRTAQAIALGRWHSCALLDNNTVKCWGYNFGGELGQEDISLRGTFANSMGDNISPINLGTGRTATKIAAGDHVTCAILDDASMKCWGRNTSGQLGQENTSTLGDAPGEMGDGLTAINLGTGRTALDVAIGGEDYYGQVCAILDDSTLKCWGYNLFGQLGYEDVQSRGDGLGEMGNTLTAISLGTSLVPAQIAVGHNHTCVVFTDATVKCWGLSTSGQLGLEQTNSIGDNGSEMGDNLSTVSLGTSLSASTSAFAISASRHTCVILNTGRLKCWGNNFTSALGLGDRVDRGDRSSQMGDYLEPVDLGSPEFPNIN